MEKGFRVSGLGALGIRVLGILGVMVLGCRALGIRALRFLGRGPQGSGILGFQKGSSFRVQGLRLRFGV